MNIVLDTLIPLRAVNNNIIICARSSGGPQINPEDLSPQRETNVNIGVVYAVTDGGNWERAMVRPIY